MSKTELDPYKYFEKYLKDCGTLVDTDLERYLNIDDSRDLSDIISAINYSIFSGGKRVRPFLLIAISDMLGVSRELSVKFSAVVEMIHTYSLIHDDLPALDNDDLRRGQPSCHKKFGEATAILAGDALLNRAIEVCLIKDDELDDEKRIKRDKAGRYRIIKNPH
jgi:geranylgeranyl pyrophosphate synthase